MNQVLMKAEEPGGCGRALLANAVGITYETASKYIPGQEEPGKKADLRDSMVHHKVALWRLNQPSRIVTDDMILAGECVPIKTCILVHSQTSPTWSQHWANLGGITPDGNILLWWNTPAMPQRIVTRQWLKDAYRRGRFNHAHEVGVGTVRKPSWLERFWFWWTVKI